ncbi:MAG: hypothetical protein MUC95_00900 [Spirochaetes bacterium]|jgi:hypothetical protein|nr:hypothetical protein [Spirochaetota bacterium]
MELQINSYPVDVDFQGESTVVDIVNSIMGWARERDLIFTEAYINDTYYPMDRIPQMRLDDVNVINFIVQSRADVFISSLNEGIIYCNKVISFIGHSLDDNRAEITVNESLQDGIDWLIEITHKLLQLLSLDEDAVKYRDKNIHHHLDIMRAYREKVRNCDDGRALLNLLEEGREIFATHIDIFKILLLSDNMRQLVMQSIDSPDVLISSIVKIRDGLPGQMQNLEEAAIAFQSGRDGEGSSKLQSFIEFVYNYSRTCFQIAPVFGVDLSRIIVDGVSLEEKNKVIHDMLNQIVEVMENNDIISLSDILEYEIRSAMEKLVAYIDLIIDNIKSKKL